jgi:signal transduction histidine kinase
VEPSGPTIALDGLICDAGRKPCREPVLLSCDNDPDIIGPDSPYAAIMSVPLLVEDKVIGVLDLGSWHCGCLKEKHLQLMAIVADQVAVSLERLNYIVMIETKNRELQFAHERMKSMQKQIIAAEKLTAMAELAASINHSINNPLAVILGHAQLLQAELPTSNEKAQTRLRLIEEAATRIGKINRKVLKIDSIVTEEYVGSTGGKILNLDKSTVD